MQKIRVNGMELEVPDGASVSINNRASFVDNGACEALREQCCR
jgi:hypothetical protein